MFQKLIESSRGIKDYVKRHAAPGRYDFSPPEHTSLTRTPALSAGRASRMASRHGSERQSARARARRRSGAASELSRSDQTAMAVREGA